MRNGQLTAAAAQIHHERGDPVHTRTGNQPQVNQPRFFHAGDDFHFPPGGRTHPFEKCLRITGVAQCAGGDHPHIVGNDLLCGAVETA